MNMNRRTFLGASVAAGLLGSYTIAQDSTLTL